jgi:hypothetical protein
MNSELLVWIIGALVAGIIGLALILFLQSRKKEAVSKEFNTFEGHEILKDLYVSKKKTVTDDLYIEAREKLKILDLEREISGYAIRRFYEASANGKITAEERDRLAEKYKIDLERIKEDIARGESVVALKELERMQKEFVNLFSERFTDLNSRIAKLRINSGLGPTITDKTIINHMIDESIGNKEIVKSQTLKEERKVKQIEETKTPIENIGIRKENISKKRKIKIKPPFESETLDADKKVEQIVSEVEKVLKKLGQIDVEE